MRDRDIVFVDLVCVVREEPQYPESPEQDANDAQKNDQFMCQSSGRKFLMVRKGANCVAVMTQCVGGHDSYKRIRNLGDGAKGDNARAKRY